MPSSKRVILIVGAQDQYGRQLAYGVMAYCQQHRPWEFHFEGRPGVPEAMDRTRLALQDWKANGVIAQVGSASQATLLSSTGRPVVNVSNAVVLKLPRVIADDVAVGRMAARHFLDRGFRHFGYCGLPLEYYSELRHQGFVEELAGASCSCAVFKPPVRRKGNWDWVRDRRQLPQWLRALPKPVAIMGCNDTRARELMVACSASNLRVPVDVAIVGSNNDDLMCALSHVALSSVLVPAERIGFEAASLLDRLMHGGEPPLKPILIPPTGVATRQSSDILAITDPDVASTLRLIKQNASDPISMKDILQEIPISRRILERRFVRLVGRTPRAEIERVHVERAKQLLVESDLKVSDVAAKSGFAGPEILAVVFKRKTDLTPTEFRARFRRTPSR